MLITQFVRSERGRLGWGLICVRMFCFLSGKGSPEDNDTAWEQSDNNSNNNNNHNRDNGTT